VNKPNNLFTRNVEGKKIIVETLKIEYHYHIYLAFKPKHQLFGAGIAERQQAMVINNSE